MFNIDSETNTITMIKKDTASFDVTLDNYKLADGDKVTFTIAPELEMKNPLLQKRVTSFSEEGYAFFFLSQEDTDLDIGTYYYDIQVDTADGRTDTIIGPAKFKIVGGVTY